MAALEGSLAGGQGRRRRPAGRRRAGTGTTWSELSRDELYERAQDAGVEGRSSMSKKELIEALRG